MSANGDISISRPPREEWSGKVPKPSAVLVLQVLGGVLLVIGAAAFGIGALLGFHELAKIWLVLGTLGVLIGPFAIASGWTHPIGMILGVVALAFLTALVPVGTIFAAVIGFLVAKNRDHVRDYYSQRLRGRGR